MSLQVAHATHYSLALNFQLQLEVHERFEVFQVEDRVEECDRAAKKSVAQINKIMYINYYLPINRLKLFGSNKNQ